VGVRDGEGVTGFWTDRPTFVTGATGLVGSWTVARLIEAGADVVCLARDWVPQSGLVRTKLIERAKVVRGDIRDRALLERILGEYEIDTTLHLAAQTVVPVANRNPVSTFDTNIRGTWALLEACRRSETVRQIVIASSDKAYGEQESLPYDESMALRGRHPYDVSKVCADLLAQAYAATYELPVAITRCGNFYGGGDLNWSRIVPGTIRSVLRGRPPVLRSDGNALRDYLYVEEGAAAYLLLAERLGADPGLRGQAFNFSCERPMTARDLVAHILAVMDADLQPEIRNEAVHEIPNQWLSAARSREQLGWRPLYSLDEGLRRTIRWYEAHLGVPGVVARRGDRPP
jgi:CDP-glucose 4,6-dehydratase